MSARQILTDATSAREEYFAPDYQRLVFETSELLQESGKKQDEKTDDDDY